MADHNHHAAPVEVDPQELRKAQDLWVSFLKWTKWSIIGTVILLIGMAIFLL